MITPKIKEFIANNFDIRQIEDEKFLRRFKNLITSELNLNSYLREILFGDLSKYKAVAAYTNRSILLDPSGIERELELLNIDINSRTIYINYIFLYYTKLYTLSKNVNLKNQKVYLLMKNV